MHTYSLIFTLGGNGDVCVRETETDTQENRMEERDPRNGYRWYRNQMII